MPGQRHRRRRSIRFGWRQLFCALLVTVSSAQSARASDGILFPAVDDVRSVLVGLINAETVRIDMSAWYLTERSISNALVNRFRAGVQVRLIGDRAALFENDPRTKEEFYWLANQGIPIRLRYQPTWYPDIMHWKATIFAGQNMVSFGSANYTPFELAPWSASNYKDETVLFTTDPSIVNAFKTKFDVYWNDTTAETGGHVSAPPYFKNFNDACALESECADYRTLYPSPRAMVISTARLEPNYPMPADLIWSQGPAFNARLIAEINRETSRVDLVTYRLTSASVFNALEQKLRQGVPVRLIVEPTQYMNRTWPEYWLTHIFVDRLWAAGASIKQRAHDGLTHMKMLVTTNVATNASSNIAEFWQRDHNYFVSAAAKPGIHAAMQQRFEIMWNDSIGFAPLTPQPPDTPVLTSPAHGGTVAGLRPTLTWQRAAFADFYDVYLGTTQSGLSWVARVPAQLVNQPPATYSWTPAKDLASGITWYWAVAARTHGASAVSPTSSFTTGATANPQPSAPPLAGSDYRLFWQHAVTGTLSAWSMDGTGLVNAQAVTPSAVSDTNWKIVGSGDFNRDGQLDLFWQNQATRLMTVWLMNGATFTGPGLLNQNTVSDTNWAISMIADMNRDGYPDLIWRHRVEGWLVVWFMNGTTFVRSSFLSPNRVTDSDWRIVAAADFDGDADNDLLWQHARTGVMAVWLMNGVTFVAPGVISNNTVTDTAWKIEAALDVNGDGKADLIWQHQTSGMLAVWFMDRLRFLSSRLLTPSHVADTGWQIVAAR
jgi:phosphatidylserine/phosphatidylglycerophosphate/cardiolipin synthase-like enzyme